MTDQLITIEVATAADLDGILKLQAENQTAQGGTLSGALKPEEILQMMSDMPQIVARRSTEIVGFLLTTSQAVHRNRSVAIVDAMFDSYKGNENSYIYGPVCVSDKERGKGLAQLMFKELLSKEPNREGILFIRTDNEASLRAHEKMGMKKVNTFVFNKNDFEVFAYGLNS